MPISLILNLFVVILMIQVFDQDIGQWDVSRVERMNSMFEDADWFNQDISGWSVSKVHDMHDMFRDTTVCVVRIEMSSFDPYPLLISFKLCVFF